MSDTPTTSRYASMDDENAGDKGAKVVLPVTAERFADVTSSLNRFMSRLVQFEPFQDSGIGLAEWAFLNEISKEDVEDKKVQRNLGLTKQRLKQVREGLKKAGYINLGPEGEGQDGKVTLTPKGVAELKTLNGKLTPMLAKRLLGREKSLEQVGKGMKTLMRVFAEPKPGRPGTDS
jgi:DNA-binding MarR family transcriptional regulator